jgi:hypothetical protein
MEMMRENVKEIKKGLDNGTLGKYQSDNVAEEIISLNLLE